MLSPLEGLPRTELPSPVHLNISFVADPTTPVQADAQGQSTYQTVRKETVLKTGTTIKPELLCSCKNVASEQLSTKNALNCYCIDSNDFYQVS